MGVDIDSLWILVCFGVLCLASWQDLKWRRVDDAVWLMPPAIFLISLSSLSQLTSLAISMAVMLPLAILLFYAKIVGGADAKALATLPFILPQPPLLLASFLYATATAVATDLMYMGWHHVKGVPNGLPMVPMITVGLALAMVFKLPI